MKFKKTKSSATNEFNQTIEGNSLSKDAWRRLKKNKMAVIGMVIVILYGLIAACASLLPIYPYDEIILDHQQLPPSLTKTAGELMMQRKQEDLFAKAWKAGRLAVTEEQDAMLKGWIKENQTTKVWAFCYEEGIKQLEAGTYKYTDAEQKTIDKLNTSIQSAILVSVKKLYYKNDTGKNVDMSKMTSDELEVIYADLIGADIALVEQSTVAEVRSQVQSNIKAANAESELTDEELQNLVDMELDSMGGKGVENVKQENLYGKIETQIKKDISKQLTSSLQDGSSEESWPIKREISFTDRITAKIEASKMNDRRYYLGTDNLGRDMLSRIIYGGQISIAIGLVGTLTSVFIGIVLGAIAGYVGGKTDFFIMRFVDILYGLPYMLLVIICMAIFGRNITNLFFALAMVSWLTIARMVRGQIMSLKNSEYVEAARSMGASTGRIIFRHLVPNSLSVIIVYSTLRIPAFIMQESFLSFLGLGVQAPYASWGSLVGDAVQGMTNYPWRLIYPAITMTLFLFAMNFFGDGLRDAFDPQSKNMI